MWRNAVRAFIFLCLTWTAVWAQSTVQLSGTVTDQSGAVLPGVEVKATQTSTGLERAALTNETRSYVLRQSAHRTVPARGQPLRFPLVCANGNRALRSMPIPKSI